MTPDTEFLRRHSAVAIRKCITLVNYFSERYNRELTAVVVDSTPLSFYIRNSGESLWIWKSKCHLTRY